MNAIDPALRPHVPAHVPLKLVRAFNFDTAPGMRDNAHATLAQLHQGPRIFYNFADPTRPAGSWVPTWHSDIREILQDPVRFSSKSVVGYSALMGESWDLIPTEIDPPLHSAFRALLNPLFSPPRVRALEARVRERAAALIDAVVDRGQCEFMAAFGRPFPVSIFMELMGLPAADFDLCVQMAYDLHHGADYATKCAGAKAIGAYLRAAIEDRRRAPKDDVISEVVHAEVGGRRLTPDELIGICFLLFGGGIDTVAASLGLYFRHLASTPDNQKRLRDNPALIPDAVEELLRAFSVVGAPRRVARDLEFAGVEMKKGDMITLITPLASLDPRIFPDPLRVDFGRGSAGHGAFSFGPHRCLGSHLARRELAIALEEWTRRVPVFRLTPGARVEAHGGLLIGVDRLPLSWL